MIWATLSIISQFCHKEWRSESEIGVVSESLCHDRWTCLFNEEQEQGSHFEKKDIHLLTKAHGFGVRRPEVAFLLSSFLPALLWAKSLFQTGEGSCTSSSCESTWIALFIYFKFSLFGSLSIVSLGLNYIIHKMRISISGGCKVALGMR